MKIVAFDPSSTRTGYAVLKGPSLPRDLVEAGIIKPEKTKAEAIERAWSMARQAVKLLNSIGPLKVIVETPARTVRGKKQNRQAQAIYGMGVGAFITMIELEWGATDRVAADRWTQKKKDHRAKELALSVAGYDRSRDRGMDCADAIELGEWFCERLTVRGHADTR